jgi:hypothetical protein
MHALEISGGILIGVFILIVIISIFTVNRGATQMQDMEEHGRRH